MIPEIGLACLWLAAALALAQLVSGFGALGKRGSALGNIVRPLAIVQGLLVAGAFLALIVCFAQTDLSVKLVAENSHSAKPFLYKVAGTWGNHEGSMLLWVTIMGLGGALVALVEKRLPEPTMRATLAAQAFISLGFYFFLLITSNPFIRLNPAPFEGAGLNPLLQDPGLAFHPPTLYIGYVGLSIAFSFAVGALVTREVDQPFARAMRPWVLGAWLFLTLGITAGSYWSYYILGWGGWWFWDPVENASLMPWLAATALLHSVSVLASRNALRTWTVMLALVAFSMSMVGTFLVRSGILTSVHAFAVDPKRGSVILALLVINIGAALTLFAFRAATVTEGERFAPVSREGALVFNNVMLTAILSIVLIGTLYPLVTDAMGVRVSVGPPYFNPASAIFLLPMLAALLVGPLLRWRHDRLARVRASVVIPIAIFGGLLLALAVIGPQHMNLLPMIGLALAPAVAVASVLPLKGRSLKRTPLAVWGMVAAHLGVAVSLFGMASDSSFSVERLVAAKVGQSVIVGPWRVTLKGVMPVTGPNWTALQADVAANYKGGELWQLTPQSRSFWAPPQTSGISSLATRWNGQLYTVLGDEVPDASGVSRWQLRLWWKPWVTMIWAGGLMIAFGGLLALIGRVADDLKRIGVRRRIGDRRVAQAEARAVTNQGARP